MLDGLEGPPYLLGVMTRSKHLEPFSKSLTSSTGGWRWWRVRTEVGSGR